MADGAPNTMGDVPVAVQSDIPFWQVPWKFAVHAIVGTLIFAIIAAVAVALNLSIKWLETYGVSIVIIYGLEAAEYALFITDLAAFGVFIWRTLKRTVRDL